jgi:hypothetical protein
VIPAFLFFMVITFIFFEFLHIDRYTHWKKAKVLVWDSYCG